MDTDVFYLHEDEWGMVEIIPKENLVRSQTIAQEAQEFGAAHFDGFGWTDMYIIPEPDHQIDARQIPLAELTALVANVFVPASVVQSGYSSYRETISNAFAFSSANKAAGAFYGNQKDGVVTRLCFIPPRSDAVETILEVGNILNILGTKYGLILTDWWHEQIVRLDQLHEIINYLRDDD